jgi:glycogen(starch) synthase
VAFKSIVFVCRDLTASDNNDVAPFTMEIAEVLAAAGDIVHVITRSPDTSRVEFKNGVWLHYMQLRNFAPTPDAASRNIPQDLWNWSNTALAEVKRISGHRVIDAVEAPLWNCEGAAFLFDGTWPLVTNLQAPLHLWLKTHAENRQDQEWMKSVGTPLMELEKELMMRSDAVRFFGSAARDDIENAYGLSFEDRILISPHGSPCERPVTPLSQSFRDHG